MTANPEDGTKTFEERMAEAIRQSVGILVNGELYSANVEVELKGREEVLDYLVKHQNACGRLHGNELNPEVDNSEISGILTNPTKEQAMDLARRVDKAYSGDKAYAALRHVKDIPIGGIVPTSISPPSHLL